MRYRRIIVSATLLLLLTGSLRAQENPALYPCTAVVTGTDMRQRPLGFAECFQEVLLKVSGQPRLAGAAAVASLAEHADSYVASYSYADPRAWFLHHDDQGTYDRSYELNVRFDPARIDTALTTLGTAPWRGPRPLLTPIIIVRRDETPYLLSSDTPRGVVMRETITRLAAAYGLGVHFPTENDLASWGIGLIGPPSPLGPPDPTQLRVTGSLDWNVQAAGWIGTWTASVNGEEHDWLIKGVGFDRAFADMIRGAVVLVHGGGTP